jgi:hypothetical protein
MMKLKGSKKSSNKLQTKKENTNNSEDSKNIINYQGIQQLIFEDVKNITKLNNLIEIIILALENFDKKKIKETSKIIKEIYDFFLIKNKNKISIDLKSFLESKLRILMKVFIEVLENIEDDEEEELKILLNELKDYFQYSSEEILNLIFEGIAEKIILTEDLVESQIIKHIIKYLTNFIPMMTEVISLKLFKKDEIKYETYFNLYNYLLALGKISQNEMKKKFQLILIYLMNQASIPKEILSNILVNLNKVILENLENPLIFSDFLIDVYEKNEDYDLKILSLSGLFILITKYKLDYSDYYNMLYKTISLKSASKESVFECKNRNRLFKILSLSLKSPSVAIFVIFSFIKRLARICLTSNISNIAIILSLIQNVIRTHPRVLSLLVRKKKNIKKGNGSKVLDEKIRADSQFNWETMTDKIEDEDKGCLILNNMSNEECIKPSNESDSHLPKYDFFDEEVMDTYKTNAHLSCLWELYSLKNHYSFKIRALIHKFEDNFLKKEELDLNSISGLKDEDMLYQITDKSHFYVGKYDSSTQII